MNNLYYGESEPFPLLPESPNSYIADSDLDAPRAPSRAPWSLDQICEYNQSRPVYHSADPLYGEIQHSLPRQVSVPWSRGWTSNLFHQLQARSRRAQRSSYPAISSPATAPTSYPNWSPAQQSSANDFDLSFDSFDPLWLDAAPTVDDQSPMITGPVETPNRPIPRLNSVRNRTGGRRRSSDPRKLQCTLHDANGNRCTKLLAWEDTFRRHERRHVQGTVWPCFECPGKEFLSCAELRRHYQDTLAHSGKDNPEPRSVEKRPTPETLLRCPVKCCNSRRFRNLAERQDHLLHNHQEYVYRSIASPQVPVTDAAFATSPTYEGFESSPSTVYGNSPFSDGSMESRWRRARANSATSTNSSTTNWSTGECSPFGSLTTNNWPQNYTASDFQPLYGHSSYGNGPSVPDVYGGAGYGSSNLDGYDFSSHIPSHNFRSGDPHPIASAHPLPILLSSMHSGSTNSELDPHGFDPRRTSSESTRVTMDPVMAELAHVVRGATTSRAAGSRASSPDTDEHLPRSRSSGRSLAIGQLRRIYGSSVAEQRPSRQNFLERVLPGLQSETPRDGEEAKNARNRRVNRERGDVWTLVSRPHGDGPWDGLRRC